VRYGACVVQSSVCVRCIRDVCAVCGMVCVVQCGVWMCSVRGMCVCVGVMRVCGVGTSVYKKDICVHVCVSVECV
jgi:hypothetical protein